MTKQVYLCWLQACALLGCRHQSCACTCAPQLSPARPAVRAASQRLPHAPALPALHAAPWPACVSLPAQRPARLPPPTWGHTLSFAPEHHCVRCYLRAGHRKSAHTASSVGSCWSYTGTNGDRSIQSENGLRTRTKCRLILQRSRRGHYLMQLVFSSGMFLSATRSCSALLL